MLTTDGVAPGEIVLLMRVRFLLQAFAVSLLVVLFPSAAFAAPPRPVIVTLTQPDGSTFRARAWGDERSHGMATLDGYTILLDSQSKYWVYAVRSSVGVLTPARRLQGNLVVGRSNPAALPKFARPAAPARTLTAQRASSAQANIGDQKVLIILAQFANRGPIGTDANFWSNQYFGATNSVKSYYNQVSYNQLNLVPAEETYATVGTVNDGVVGWLTVPDNHPGGSFNDQYVKDAILAADPYVNFAAFDSNSDGYISMDELHIAVVAAGYESSYVIYAPCGANLWAHEDAFDDSSAPSVDGKKVAAGSHHGGYTTFGEWHCDAGESLPGHPATFGIPAHELGHDLGLPDLYDTVGPTAGIGDWSIMSTGAWNANGGYAGSSPAHPDAWSRSYEGWLTPNQVSGPLLGVNIPQIETSPTVLQLLSNPNGDDWLFESHSGTGEYFLAENRQKIGYDAGIPGCGLLIWHIDESVTYTNSANGNANHRLVDLEQADGLRELNTAFGDSGDAGDPFPGTTGNRRFTGTSNPNSNLYRGVPSGVAITNISNCNSTMSADLAAVYWFYFPVVGKHSP